MEVCEFAALVSAASELASSEMRWEKKQQKYISARPRTNHREKPGHVSAIHSNISFFVFSTQVSYFNLSLNLSFNLSDFMFFSETLLYRTGILEYTNCNTAEYGCWL